MAQQKYYHLLNPKFNFLDIWDPYNPDIEKVILELLLKE